MKKYRIPSWSERSPELRKKYAKTEDIERGHLKMIYDKLPDKFIYKMYTTDPESKEGYDALLMRFDKDSTYFKDRFIIEIKVRNDHYQSFMLEKSKLDGLKRIRSKKDRKINSECYTNDISRLVYITVSPQGTYWFNLDSLEKDFEWKEEEHWISSTDHSLGKELKKVTYIDLNKAKYIPIKTGDYIDIETVRELERESKRKKQFAGFLLWD